MNKLKKIWKQAQLSLAFALIVFLIIMLSFFVVFVGIFLSSHIGPPPAFAQQGVPLVSFAIASLFVGTFFAMILGKIPLKPIRTVIAAIDQIAEGDYSVRLNLKGFDEFKDLSQKFNHMAEELGSVELLRSDFVNNFSHEFKTPIVSIRGFAKALKWENLTDEERKEYLDIIIAESERLSELSTNILNLSKIEQQAILTDKKSFNLSEQIRLVIAMLDSKWPDKHISFQFESDEIYTHGNEELLKQVWINLLDNAVKFSPENSAVTINILKTPNGCTVVLSNPGEALSEEQTAHIFDKFYQGDRSHSTKGNGLGLTIAKRIIELHKGTIHVENKNEQIVFAIYIPKL